ncbi:MAG: hypothetical protein ABJE95_25570 [Byssovorax sp.]
MSETKQPKAPLFVDTVGGGLAALAAGVARHSGLTGATAATSSDAVAIPSEVLTVLAEIGAQVTSVAHLKDVKPTGEVVHLAAWSLYLLAPSEGELERLAAARIARDKIERKLSLSSS